MAVALGCGSVAAADASKEAPAICTLRLQVDFGADRGQAFGSLFEMTGDDGTAIAGAGFLSAYNTYYQSDRHTLHAFVRPPGGNERLERTAVTYPSAHVHHYLFDANGTVYATGRGASARTFQWHAGESRWPETDAPVAPSIAIGDQRLALHGNRLMMGGREVFRFDAATGRTGSYYFAQGVLFFHMAAADSPERQTYLYACPWAPASGEAVNEADAIVLPLTAPGEFPYSYGQIDDSVVVGTNNGGFYRFREGSWETLRQADPATSFQLYTMLNYYDRLLMGHYPSGELYELIGDALVRLEGVPPRPEGASPRAREAQTLTLYRGELFAGIWPWGEVWRLPGPNEPWEYAGRLFTQPEMLVSVTAPYEAEVSALGEPVNNLWGQRVTSLVPHGASLLASTSNKNGAPMEPRLTFLSEAERWREYGAVHSLRLPGHVSVPIVWTGEATEFVITISAESLSVSQDGRLLGVTPLEPAAMAPFRAGTVRWGNGVYGPFAGAIQPASVDAP